MNKEEKEQWLYETYNYTSNFDFSRLDKHEEANDDICIDTLILDYTMLYEFHKEEIKIKNKVINDLLKRISNLEFDVKEKDRRIDKAIEYMQEALECGYHGADLTFDKLIKNTTDILKESDKK